MLDVKDDAADLDDTGIDLSQGLPEDHGHAGQINQRRSGPGNRPQIQLAEQRLPAVENPHQPRQASDEKNAKPNSGIQQKRFPGLLCRLIFRL